MTPGQHGRECRGREEVEVWEVRGAASIDIDID